MNRFEQVCIIYCLEFTDGGDAGTSAGREGMDGRAMVGGDAGSGVWSSISIWQHVLQLLFLILPNKLNARSISKALTPAMMVMDAGSNIDIVKLNTISSTTFRFYWLELPPTGALA